jgi:hypothetical protein
MSVISELKRRNVFRVGAAYIVVAWLLLQFLDVIMPMLTLPDWVGTFFLLAIAVGFPIAIIIAWACELTPEGIKRESEIDRSRSIRNLIPVFVTLLIVACGDSQNAQTATAGEDSAGAVDFCTCVNEPLNTDARLKACGDLMDSMTPEETATRSIACREALPVPEGGPDLCFCLRTTTTDADIMQACEALIPEDMTPMQLTRTIAECSR